MHIEPDVQPIVMGRPVNLSDLDRAVNAQLGIDISDPYPDSIQKACATCGREVWVGPRQQDMLQKYPRAIILCPQDAVAMVGNADETTVYDLGNKHPRGN